jgi:hypothetical protein
MQEASLVMEVFFGVQTFVRQTLPSFITNPKPEKLAHDLLDLSVGQLDLVA